MMYIALVVVLIYLAICAVFYVQQEKIIFLPEQLPQDFQFSFSTPFQEVFLKNPDGAQLHGLHFQTKDKAKGCILYFHGNAGSLRRWGDIVDDFTLFGYEVLVVDYRTYGKSQGQLSEKVLHQDAKLFYDYLLQSFPPHEIIIFGRSIGTGIATRLAAENTAKMLILETPYTNLKDMARRYTPFLPYSWLLKYHFNSDKAIQNVACPVYIFHGTDDQIVPYDLGKKLSSIPTLSGNSILITVPGGQHNNLGDFPIYQENLQKILIQ